MTAEDERRVADYSLAAMIAARMDGTIERLATLMLQWDKQVVDVSFGGCFLEDGHAVALAEWLVAHGVTISEGSPT